MQCFWSAEQQQRFGFEAMDLADEVIANSNKD